MAKNYSDLLTSAHKHKVLLDRAIAHADEKKILYYRGKYLANLKHAHKLNPTGNIPSTISGARGSLPIETIINIELEHHQTQIKKSLSNNKRNSSIKNNTLSKEIGLKIRRLATRYDQINFSTGATHKQNMKNEMIRDSVGLVGTAIKTPFMAAAKVISIVGPLAVTITFLPIRLVAAGISTTIDIYNGKTVTENPYNNTSIAKLSDDLKKGIKQISKEVYEKTGQI